MLGCVGVTVVSWAMCRSDLEKAISAHGGPTAVAQQLGWKLKAKGRYAGHWLCAIEISKGTDLVPSVQAAQGLLGLAGECAG